MPSISNIINNREQRNGANMPLLRETFDESTGETYHVETTRQAKRRHLRNAGRPVQPTAGQINAAEIWNRQEEKIKRDKEREQKRKRDKVRQEAKDNRLKEIQDERLREGKISIEDTWGKVNASQNRIHKFFGAPKSTVASEQGARSMAPPPKPSSQSPSTPRRTQMHSSLKQRVSPCSQHEQPVEFPIVATQVVEDTLLGLSSQDFFDDLAHDQQENISPARRLGLRKSSGKRVDSFESFNDDDIDDDMLLALVSSQKDKQRISQPSEHQIPKQWSDSFKMDGITDGDLLQGLEDYENDVQPADDEELLKCVESFERRQDQRNVGDDEPHVAKKRRMLPWDRK